jgi:DNA-directed RNA polymerase subunit RPC12/RpoP
MKTTKLRIACPRCESPEVFYSCTPNCCFNHVCSNCGTTFETETSAAGGVVTGLIPPDPAPDATDPAAECAKCHAASVYQLEDGGVVCGNCGARLVLELTEVAEG